MRRVRLHAQTTQRMSPATGRCLDLISPPHTHTHTHTHVAHTCGSLYTSVNTLPSQNHTIMSSYVVAKDDGDNDDKECEFPNL